MKKKLFIATMCLLPLSVPLSSHAFGSTPDAIRRAQEAAAAAAAAAQQQRQIDAAAAEVAQQQQSLNKALGSSQTNSVDGSNDFMGQGVISDPGSYNTSQYPTGPTTGGPDPLPVDPLPANPPTGQTPGTISGTIGGTTGGLPGTGSTGGAGDPADTLEAILDETKSVNQKLLAFYGNNSNSANVPSLFTPPTLDTNQTIRLAARTLINSFKSSKEAVTKDTFKLISSAPTVRNCAQNNRGGPSFNTSACQAQSYSNQLRYYGRYMPLPFPYASAGDIRSFSYGDGKTTEANNFLLSPNTLFDKSEFGNLSGDGVKLLDGSKLTTDEQAARVFSDFLLNPLPLKMPASVKNPNSDDLLEFSVKTRSYAAFSALLRANVEDMITLRKRQGAPANASLLKIEEEMATKRINKASGDASSWYKKISDSSPETVQREIALLLAEMNYQMYLNRRMNEKLLLTVTAIGTGSLKFRQPELDQDEE